MDLEDGDFIGIDENKCIYKMPTTLLKHQLNTNLIDVLKILDKLFNKLCYDRSI